jgi:serine/threonine protein kinase
MARDSGTIFDGKYELLTRLGSGGMGEVYRVRHLHLQQPRVIKILRPDRAADPAAAQRFLHEARTATQIKHPNVAILYDYSRLPDGSFYMVWENIEGEDVGQWLRSRGPFPLPLAIELGIQGLRGLEAIHAAGVIHRDLSPDNLMITRDPRGRPQVKIIDLGLAKSLTSSSGEITEAGMFIGKLRYCSPEQAGALKGGELDHRSDLYSFSAVLYEMVCGLPPFDSETPHGFVLKRLAEDPLPLVGRNPQVAVPSELDQVVRRGLERDRDQRWPDAVSYIHALARIADVVRGVQTQEMPATRRPEAPRASPATPFPPKTAAAAARPSTREMSREERLDLLAQIDRAAKRVEEGSQVAEQALQALGQGRLDEARELARQLEAAHPRARALADLKDRLRVAEETEDRRRRLGEAEQMVDRYLHERKQTLAGLALETLVDLHPNHPRRGDYEAAVKALVDESATQQRAAEAVAAGREALRRGDLRGARQKLETAERIAATAQATVAFRAEIDAAQRGEQRDTSVTEHRRRLEAALQARQLEAAQRELEALAALEVTRVTIDDYRQRVETARAAAADEARSQEFERRYRERVAAKDWLGAREVALELEQALPQSERPAQMYAEASRLEEIVRRQQAIDQGVRQVEQFAALGQVREAELALRILLQMDPDNPHRRRLERQVKSIVG